jgi:hypothetical protein
MNPGSKGLIPTASGLIAGRLMTKRYLKEPAN